MTTFSRKGSKLSSDQVRQRREAIEKKYSETVARAEKSKEKALKALQSVCPHSNSDSGEGGSLDYWFECKDCGKD